MADDDKNPAREVITDYAQFHFRYSRTADGTVYAQRNGHPMARPIRSQGTTGPPARTHGRTVQGRHRCVQRHRHEGGVGFDRALALTGDLQPVHIRVAPGYDGATWLDLGRDDGRSVRIHPTGWDIRTPDPRGVCWRRRGTAPVGQGNQR